jgi:hypothetical protein
MTTTTNAATAESDNGTPPATGDNAETTTETTPPATGEAGKVPDSSTQDDGTENDEAGRTKFYQKLARDQETELKQLRKDKEDRERAEMSDTEKLKADNETLSAKLEQIESEALRNRVATEAGLSPELAARLQGDTEEDLAADAKRLAEMVGAVKRTATPAAGDAGIGGRTTDPSTDPLEQHRRFTAGR